jgi:hypothetical protein
MRVVRVVKRGDCEIDNVLHHFDIRNDTFSGGGASLGRRRNAMSIALQPRALQIYVNLRLNFIC